MVIATWHGCRQRLSASRVCTACAGYAHPFHVCIPLHVSVYWCVYHVILTRAFCMSDVQHREHVSLGGVCFTRTMYSSVARVRYTHPLHEAVFLCHHHCQLQASLSRDRWRRLLYVSDTTCALQACVTHIRLPFVQNTTDACLPHCRWSKPVALVVWACLIHASVTRAD